MKRILIACAILTASVVHAQQFRNGFELALPDSLEHLSLAWVDFDNDGIKDVAVQASVQDQVYVYTFKSDTSSGFSFRSFTATGFSSASLVPADVDRDNDIDLILSGMAGTESRTAFLLNDENFHFHMLAALDRQGNIAFIDLDNDGMEELIVANEKISFFKLLGSSWTLVHDTITFQSSAMVVHDFDGDRYADVLLSGKSDGKPTLNLLQHDDSLHFKIRTIENPIDGTLVKADLNHDGQFDFIASGKNSADTHVNRVFINAEGAFSSQDTIVQAPGLHFFPADFNSDGHIDLHFFRAGAAELPLHRLEFFRKSVVQLAADGLLAVAPGDFEVDGDLDLLMVDETGGEPKLRLLVNDTDMNRAPAKPGGIVGLNIHGHALLYWNRSADDHTATEAITYDVTLQTSNREQMIGGFDLVSLKRMVVAHGNVGTRNFVFVKIPSSDFQYVVQSIDNSFHASGVGKCTGPVACSPGEAEDVLVCRNESLTLKSEKESLWFSFRRGYLGEGASVDFIAADQDTVISFTPSAEMVCSALKVYRIKAVKQLIKRVEPTDFVCEGTTVHLSIAGAWSSISWQSANAGALAPGSELNHKLMVDDTLKALASNGTGCAVEYRYPYRISKPMVAVENSTYQILRGQSVQLVANGAESYAWTPTDGLDNAAIFNPVATPLHTTQYIVTGTDSIGCTVTASVLVIVEGTAFIPNLFTPNSDGNNDEIRIYGVSEVKNFHFSIHNREGSTVYETQDPQQATVVGWNGMAYNTLQPSGVYFWKVRGEHASGAKLTLNGKTTGSIVLIR